MAQRRAVVSSLHRFAASGLLACAITIAALVPAAWAADDAISLDVVGGLGGVTQYTKFEQPFWESELPKLSGGRLTANIRPLDSGGFRGQEMLQLMRLGLVPFGTALVAMVTADEPEFNAVDLPVLNPDIATLRRTIAALRPRLADILRQRYDVELLGVYTYPAQVIFCKEAFTGLSDLAGRKVRTSSVSQSELMEALGAVPVRVPFAQIGPSLRDGVADCALTGTLSGYEIGLSGLASHVHQMSISWGISLFGANLAAWNALPPDLRDLIRKGVSDLERQIWSQAEADTVRGLDCNLGAASCGPAPASPMTLVPISAADNARRRQLLQDIVLPRWIERCGDECIQSWNTYLAPVHSIMIEAQ